MKLLFCLASILLFCVSAKADPELRAKYSPHPESGFPQIIQADDYATIKFIESLYTCLAQITPEQDHSDQFGHDVDFTITDKSLDFHSLGNPKRTVTVRQADANTVTIQTARFTNRATTIFYATLSKILHDFSEQGAWHGARFVQFGNRAYKRNSIVEFNFGTKVVQIWSSSNGPKDEERLYILDVVAPKDSMCWGHP